MIVFHLGSRYRFSDTLLERKIMTDTQEIKNIISKHFNNQAAAGINAIFQVNLKEGGEYYIGIQNSDFTIEEGSHNSPSVTLTTDQSTLKGIIDGSVNGMQAFMMGKLKFSGDMGLAMKLKDLFA